MRAASGFATVLGLILLACLAPVAAQGPPSALSSRTVEIPASVALEPNGSVTFRRPSDGATLTVSSTSPAG